MNDKIGFCAPRRTDAFNTITRASGRIREDDEQWQMKRS